MSPLAMLVMFSALAFRRGGMDFGSVHVQGGFPLAILTSFVSLIAMLPISMNQFAVDRAGLTMVLLSPLPEGQYLAGKAVGSAMISLPLAYFCTLAAFVMFPGGSGRRLAEHSARPDGDLPARRSSGGRLLRHAPQARRPEQHRGKGERSRPGGPARSPVARRERRRADRPRASGDDTASIGRGSRRSSCCCGAVSRSRSPGCCSSSRHASSWHGARISRCWSPACSCHHEMARRTSDAAHAGDTALRETGSAAASQRQRAIRPPPHRQRGNEQCRGRDVGVQRRGRGARH